MLAFVSFLIIKTEATTIGAWSTIGSHRLNFGSPAMRMIEKYKTSLKPPEFLGLEELGCIFIIHIAGLPKF